MDRCSTGENVDEENLEGGEDRALSVKEHKTHQVSNLKSRVPKGYGCRKYDLGMNDLFGVNKYGKSQTRAVWFVRRRG